MMQGGRRRFAFRHLENIGVPNARQLPPLGGHERAIENGVVVPFLFVGTHEVPG